jgi:hypothetical protein
MSWLCPHPCGVFSFAMLAALGWIGPSTDGHRWDLDGIG